MSYTNTWSGTKSNKGSFQSSFQKFQVFIYFLIFFNIVFFLGGGGGGVGVIRRLYNFFIVPLIF